MTISLAINFYVRENIKASILVKEKTDLYVFSHAMKNLLIFNLVHGVFTPREVIIPYGNRTLGVDKLPLDGTPTEIKEAYKLILTLQDTNGLLSLLNFNSHFFKNMVRDYIEDDHKVEIITDSLLDWIDTDHLKRLHGAEGDYYRIQKLPYKPRNNPIQYEEEILLIRGMDRELYMKISPFITVFPSTGFNPNTAPRELLKAYFNIKDDAMLTLLENSLKKKPIITENELISIFGRKFTSVGNIVYFPSKIVEISLKVPKERRTIFQLRMVVDFNPSVYRPYSVLQVKEE